MQKRLQHELKRAHTSNDVYVLDYDDADITQLHAVINTPEDSLYAYAFIRVKLSISERYPFEPPKVHFYNHCGTRIHPNLYADGKVCLSILGTWNGPSWTSTLSIDTLLRTIQSLLDNEPMKHEPGRSNSPLYNHYVEREKWNTLLLAYLTNESRPVLRNHMVEMTNKHTKDIKAQLAKQKDVVQPSGRIGYNNISTPRDGDRIWRDIEKELVRQ